MGRSPVRKAGKGKVIVLGLPEIDRKLKQLTPALEKKVIRDAVRASLWPVQQAVKQAAPVASGATRGAVKVRVPKGRRKGKIRAQVIIGEGDYKGHQFYAAFVEFGHDEVRGGRRGTGGGKVVGRKEGTHFMEQAFDRTAEAAKEDCENRILSGADMVIRNLGKQG